MVLRPLGTRFPSVPTILLNSMNESVSSAPTPDAGEVLATLSVPEPARKRIAALGGLWPFMRPYKGKLGLAFVLLCLASIAMLTVPLATRDLIDHGFVGGSTMHRHFLALFGISLIWGAAVAGRFYYVTWIGERVTSDLRSAIYRHMLRQSPEFFETTRTGEVLSRLTTD